jgi:hypothetical protein
MLRRRGHIWLGSQIAESCNLSFLGEFTMRVSAEGLVKELQLDIQAVHSWCEATRSRKCN